MSDTLDPNIILSGTSTTHPVTPVPLGEQFEQGARTGLMRAQAGLVGEQTTAENLQNQISQINLQNAKFMGQAQLTLMNQLRAKAGAGYSAPTGGVDGPAPAAGSIAPGLPGAVGNPEGATAQSQTTPGVIDPSAPPPPQGVSPYAWDYANKHGYQIDQTHDWYLDKDGSPISHYAGPELTPGGRPNMMSADVQYQLGDILQGMGAPPQFIAGMINDGLGKAQAFDKQNGELMKDMASAADSRAKAKDTEQQIQMRIMGFMANSADAILQSPNPAASLLQDIGTHPGLWNRALAANKLDPNNFNPTDPQQAQAATAMLKGMQSQSPIFLDRQNKASEAETRTATAAAAGIHVVTTKDAFGAETSNIVNPQGKVLYTQKGGVDSASMGGPENGPKLSLTDVGKQYAAESIFGQRSMAGATPGMRAYVEQLKFNAGITPADEQAALSEVKAIGAAATAAGRREGNLTILQNSMKTFGDQLLQAAEGVTRERLPIVNAALAKGAFAAGSAAEERYAAAWQSYITDYSRLMNGGAGVTSDSARKEAAEALPKYVNLDQLKAGVDQLSNRETNAMQKAAATAIEAMANPDKYPTVSRIQKALGLPPGILASAAPAAAATTTSAPPSGIGTIRGKYIQIGADPSQQSSWKLK